MSLSTKCASFVTLHLSCSWRLLFEVQSQCPLLLRTHSPWLPTDGPDVWWSVWLRIFFFGFMLVWKWKAIPRCDVLPVLEQCRAVTVSHGSACGSQLAELRDYAGKCSKKLLAHSHHMAAWESVLKYLFSFGIHSLHMFNKCIPKNNVFWVVPEKTRLRSQK